MRVLVTGGAGFIGSHVCKVLAQEDHTPIVVDDLSQGHREFVKWGPFHKISLLDKAKLFEVFEQERIEAVCHLASKSIVEESMANPDLYLSENVQGTVHLLEACKQFGCKRFVFSSTASVYGNPTRTPIEEDDPLNPINPYGESKLLAERKIQQAAEEWGLNFVIFRFFNAAGASFDLDIGEKHLPETHLIPRVIDALLHDRPITLFGDDYKTSDGTCERDFVHVLDIANAHLKALDMPSAVINLGLEKGYSVKFVIEQIAKKLRKIPHIQICKRREGDSPVLVASHKKALEMGLIFQYGLEEMIETAIKWHTQTLAKAKL
ncbi:MAG: UDP-glucose 4-epimerase [Chlamydiae bacterium]|nr:UDP-glucose 4-epimerase [Chlamydiota bacterium]